MAEENGLHLDVRRALAELRKRRLKGLVFEGHQCPVMSHAVIPTGSLSLDIALGIGGWPRGTVNEILGNEGVGKTTLALHAVAEAQRQGHWALFVDAEHSLFPERALALGVDLERLIICKPGDGTEALDVMVHLLKSLPLGLCVVDSVSALTPAGEAEGQVAEQEIGSQARLMSKALRILTPIVAQRQACILFLNQIRYKVGLVFGNPETTSGGNALKFYAATRVQITRQLSKELVDEEGQRIGNQIVIQVLKNKLALPFRKVNVDLYYQSGVDRLGELLTLGIKYGVLQAQGAWYSWGEEKLGQGREKVREWLLQHPEKTHLLEKEIRRLALAEGEKDGD